MKVKMTAGGLLLLAHVAALPAVAMAQKLDEKSAAKFADLALACVAKEYPNNIAHVLQSDQDVAPPRELAPAFYGCYDWHSSVHGHWLLVRLARLFPASAFAAEARAAVNRSLTDTKIASEVAYLAAPGRISFERPYGLAWLLQLAAELREWNDPQARRWAAALAPLEDMAATRIKTWLPKLTHPIRYGEHSQTAFAFGLILDWARVRGDTAMIDLITKRSRDYHVNDRACPLRYEPSGQDFLSPCLAEADLMRRILPPSQFARWLAGFLPEIPGADDGGDDDQDDDGAAPRRWLEPAVVSDRSDPKLAHLDGLNLSRAWMLEGMAQGLSRKDRRRAAILAAARDHRVAGLASVTGDHYEGGHWLGSYATYLVTGRGLRNKAAGTKR